MYAYHKKLDYFSTECVYSPNAYRGHARAYIKDLEAIRPSSIIDIIYSGESLSIKKDIKMPIQGVCERCGYLSSMTICKACNLLEGLNKGLPKLGIGQTQRLRKRYNLTPAFSNSTTTSTNSLNAPSLSSLNTIGDEYSNNNEEQLHGAIEETAEYEEALEDKLNNSLNLKKININSSLEF